MRCEECGSFLLGRALRDLRRRLFGRKLPPPRPMTGFARDVAEFLDRDVLEIAKRQLVINQLRRK